MKDPQREAMRLINHFTLSGYIQDLKSSEYMVGFAKFAAIQHLTEITTPDLTPEEIIFNFKVVKEISSLEISYPLWAANPSRH